MNRTSRRFDASVGVWAVLIVLATLMFPTAAQAHDDAGAAGLSAGRTHTCAIDAAGSISCWGVDNGGVVTGPDGAAGVFKYVSAGNSHTCAIDAADSISCWGLNSDGQVSGPDGAAGTFKTVSASTYHTCAIDAADSISCWGDDFGDGFVSGPDAAAGSFKTVAAGDFHTCAIDAADSISCWGNDAGDGYVTGPDGVAGTFKTVSVGSEHTCAIDAADSISCWGNDDEGQVSGPDAAAGAFKTVSAGGNDHTCAIDAADSISCWGQNTFGKVSGPDAAAGAFKTVSAGFNHTCAIDAADSISCWGSDPGDGRVTGPDAAPGSFGTNLTLDVTVEALGPDPTSASSIKFAIKFSKPVDLTTFENADVTVGGTAGATSAVLSDDPSGTANQDFIATVIGMTGPGTVTASLAANVAEGAGGQPNQASTSTDNTVTYKPAFNPGPTASISGLARIGSTLTARAGSPSPTPSSLSYRWFADGKQLATTTKTLKLTSTHHGKRIQVRVYAAKPGYLTASDLSPATARISSLQAKIISLELDDYTVRRGQRIYADLERLAPGEPWSILLDGKKLTSGKASSKGTALTSFVIPSNATLGIRTIRANGAFPDRTDPDRITVR